MTQPLIVKIRQTEWPFWMGLIFFIAVLFCCVRLFNAFSLWLKDRNQLPLEELVLEGELQQVGYQDVFEALKPQMHNSFYSLDVNKAQQLVESIDWVYWASVRKEWPNVIRINLEEQQALVEWNGDFLLNKYGQVFQANTEHLNSPLAGIFGPEGEEKTALGLFNDFNQLLKTSNLNLTQMELSDRHGVKLVLNTGVALNLGREDWMVRVKRFLDYYPMLQQQHPIEYVDLRYDTGFAVKTQTNKTQTAG